MYKNMSEILSPGASGSVKLDCFVIDQNNYRAMIDGILPGRYMRLTHNGSVIMSDTQMEKRTNREFCISAYGDVLIGGLGIGLILLAIQDEERIRSITVLEKYQDVIDLIAPQIPLNDKVHIICADVFNWKPPKDTLYDCIYMDIWNYINRDVYDEEMKPLKRKFGHYLKSKEDSPNRFNKCWAEWHAKNGVRL